MSKGKQKLRKYVSDTVGTNQPMPPSYDADAHASCIRAALTELDVRARRIEELEKQVAALRADYNHGELLAYRRLDAAGGVSHD